MTDGGSRREGALGRLVGGAGRDLNALTNVLRLLPDIVKLLREVRDSLAEITALTRSLDREVTLMRQGVDKLDGRIVELEEQVADLSRVLRPFRRARARLGGGSERATGEPDELSEAS